MRRAHARRPQGLGARARSTWTRTSAPTLDIGTNRIVLSRFRLCFRVGSSIERCYSGYVHHADASARPSER